MFAFEAPHIDRVCLISFFHLPALFFWQQVTVSPGTGVYGLDRWPQGYSGEFLHSGMKFDAVGSPVVSPQLSSLQGHFPLPARRIHFKILTLLALSPTYSYDLEKLRSELIWDEQQYGNFQMYLSTAKHEGKQLYALSPSETGFRVHLIKDIYLNAVSQRLRAFHEKHYKATQEILTAEALKRFLCWDCPTRCFKDWLTNHGLAKLLSPPDGQTEGCETSLRPARPQLIRTVRDLSNAFGFVRQQYNLVSVVTFSRWFPKSPIPQQNFLLLPLQ